MDPPALPADADFGTRVERVQELVHDLGAPGWSTACTRSAEALDALAGALRSLSSDRRVRRTARNVWADARGLRTACAGSFEAADLMKSGLEASVEGLERAMKDTTGKDSLLASRMSIARESVKALDADKSWVFQRARVQDAFRTVTTAFAVASELEASDRKSGNDDGAK